MKKVSVANPSKTVFFSPFRDGLWAVFVLQNQTFSGRPQRTLWKHFLLPSLAQQQIVLLSLLRRCFGLYVTESVSASAPNLKYTWLGAYQQNRRLRTVSVIWINTSEIENIIIYIIIYFFFFPPPNMLSFFFSSFFLSSHFGRLWKRDAARSITGKSDTWTAAECHPIAHESPDDSSCRLPDKKVREEM